MGLYGITGPISTALYSPSEGSRESSKDLIRAFDEEIRSYAGNSYALHRAVDRLVRKLIAPGVWDALGTRFQSGTEALSMVERLVIQHLSTSANGMDLVRSLRIVDELVTGASKVIRSLTPEVRSEMVSRWSDPERTSVYMTSNQVIAVEIPGTGFRCPVMCVGLSGRGWSLTQHEVTQLLTARLEDRSDGATALSLLPEVAEHQRYLTGHLWAALVGVDGSPLEGVDQAAVRGLALSLLNAFESVDVTPAIHEPLCAFFDRVGDDEGAARSYEQLAQTHERMGRHATPRKSDGLYLQAANCRSIAASYFEKAASLKAAAIQYREAGASFAKAHETSRALEHHELAAVTMSGAATLCDVESLLGGMREPRHGELARLCSLYERCAEIFAARDRRVSAALLHILAADYLVEHRPKRLGRDEVSALATHHRRRARDYFNAAELRGAPQDLRQLVWYSIERRLDELTSQQGLSGENYVVRFVDASDIISFHEFEATPGDAWVLMLTGERPNGVRIYDLVTAHTMRRLAPARRLTDVFVPGGERKWPHPILPRAFEAGDFIEGAGVIDMILSAPREPKAGAIPVSLSAPGEELPPPGASR
ncbi:hypothetical protein [Pandoraea commovens]|uniref:Tetratricopeptide repeat protein n=1 Tax=Pandoraea commovens TaxID=2508289 RepID=A0A5E4SCZ8_9BURK|nr:hypothetical protein [Pandoraea commovens]VVD72118.1 hypothetical protein PCO31010_00671 [Pandoraea commovens]